MTTICVTFICDFLKSSMVPKKRSSIDIIVKKNKSSKIKSTFEEQVDLKFIETPLTVTHNVNKPIRYLHIEYNLLPKFIYKVDIVFWGTVAKVHTKDGVKATKAVMRGNHIFIAFSIKHKFVLDEIDLLNLKCHTATFAFCTDKNIIAASARQEDAKTFYFLKNDIDSKEEFAEAFEYDPNSVENMGLHSLKSAVDYALSDLLNFCVRNEILSILNIIPDYLYRKKILFILKKMDENLDIKCLNKEAQIIPDEISLKIKQSRKSGASIKSNKFKEKEVTTLLVKIPCEFYFTDPNMALFDLKNSNKSLSGAFIIIDVKHLINEELKKKLNPIILKIEHMYNVPASLLIENKFEFLFAKYNICDETYTTNLKPITPEIEFKEHNMLFLSDENFQRFCGQISTGYFILQVNEKQCVEETKIPIAHIMLIVVRYTIMGRKRFEERKGEFFDKRKDISKILRNKEEIFKYNAGNLDKITMVGIACFRLNLLFHIPHKFAIIQNCINPTRSPVSLNNDSRELFHVTINTINMPEDATVNTNPLRSNELTSYGTCIKVEMEICVPISNILRNLITVETYYNRMILTLYEPTMARLIFSTVMLHNSYILDSNDLLPNYLLKKETQSKLEEESSLITGFIIDSGSFVIMFFEGNAKYIYDLIWIKVSEEQRKSLFCVYNSDNIYEKRFYTQFLKFRRVYTITLHCSLITLFSKHKIFKPGVMPKPCQTALRKLYFILQSITIADVTDKLLPTPQELISLDFEWGVPIHWPLISQLSHDVEPKVISTINSSETVNNEI